MQYIQKSQSGHYRHHPDHFVLLLFTQTSLGGNCQAVSLGYNMKKKTSLVSLQSGEAHHTITHSFQHTRTPTNYKSKM